MTNYLDLDLIKIHELLKEKVIKPIDLVNESFARIEENKDLNCFITINKEGAIKKALELENKEVGNNLLFGIPIALKDNMITKDLLTTCGSKILSNFIPIYDAYVVDLINQNNMIIIGKLNMDEFAMGSTNRTSFFGPVKNPWNKSLVSGGSSGGSAVCVSKRITPFTLGSDTGGSIRQPSSFCGVVGIKPTYGRISRYGLVAFSSSLDQIGPIARNVYESAVILNILSKKDDRDLTSVETNDDFTKLIGSDVSKMKIAIPKFYISDVIDKQVLNKFNEVVEMLKEKGVIVDIIDIPFIDKAVPLYQVIALGEASSNLARFDGIKYGYSTSDYNNFDELYKKTRSEGFGAEVKRRIMVGSYLLSGPNAVTYYNKALKIRRSMALEFNKVFNSYDLVIGPTTAGLPYEIDKDMDDAVKSFLDDILTIPVNMAGLPGLSLPIGFSKENLPIGMQIISDKWNEVTIYKLASFIEKELNLNLIPGGNNE